ncbi:c-type cytochrome [Legionella maioricensis]|uniref:C-type cytochrome n=1 Tax=Legionella maioricensis TaxID=2896528 RepID=A0A9X2IC70_9GAMM|nr:c-type cytochrome [Legionella maioricensis]MCL9685609.1 c-type cytochrome [Legionella maioricensis]MCL9689018.1 c-type cytochrome [Legionella maioricensis]
MTVRISVYKLILFMFITPVYGDSHHPQEFLKSIRGTQNEGGQIYQHYCANCHAKTPLIPLGAPRIGEKSDWKLRIKQGINVLFKHTDEGLNAMPARGGCFECTDEQLILAIVEIVPKEGKKVLINELIANKKYK